MNQIGLLLEAPKRLCLSIINVNKACEEQNSVKPAVCCLKVKLSGD